jgi:putative ABC transport system permease protein
MAEAGLGLLVRLVLAQWRRRPLQTLLGAALLALGVATLVFVVSVQGQLSRQLERDARGVDLVVGAKGSPLQLILSAVYHVDVPTGNLPHATLATLRGNRLVAQAIPLALGDSVRGFRIVGTEPALLELYGARFASGAAWTAPMQAVIGAQVARATGLGVGSEFLGTHGLAEGGAEHAEARCRVVGVLSPAGSVLDRLVLTDLVSVWQVHEGEAVDEQERRVLEAERQVTAILVRYASPLGAAILPRQVNAEGGLQAAAPAAEVARLFAVAGVGIETLRAFAAVLIVAALLALFITLYGALEERRYDLAILRMLGASPRQVALLLLIEAWLLAALGWIAGLALGLGAVALLGRWLAQERSFAIGLAVPWAELGALALVALAVATLAALLPAWRAARMDLARTLARQ